MRMRSMKWHKLVMACVLVGSAACGGASKTAFEFMPNMMDSPAVKAQEVPMRLPPEGTIPRGFTPYPFAKEDGALAHNLENPLSHTREVFLQGKARFETFCTVCHGMTGKGDGLIVPKFPRPPSLLSDKVREWPDGRLFHVISRGQNLMPSYATRLSPEDRWAVALYVRALQRAAHPTKDDIESFRQVLQQEGEE